MKYTETEITPRQIANAKKWIKKELDKVPLFPELVTITDPVERVTRQHDICRDMIQRLRDQTADHWRRGRKMLREMDPAKREAVLWCWNDSYCPARAEYFVSMVYNFYRGRNCPFEKRKWVMEMRCKNAINVKTEALKSTH